MDKNTDETVSCNICQTSDLSFFCKAKSKYSDKVFTIVECNHCGLIFVNPRNSHIDTVKEYINHKDIVAYFDNLYYSRISDGMYLLQNFIINRFGHKKTFLDVGAGIGAMMMSAKIAQFEKIDGIELNPLAANHGKQIHPDCHFFSLDICDKKQFNIIKQKYDVVLCHHTLEHFYDPLTAIKNMRHLMEIGGLLLISVPNINHNSFKKIKKNKVDNEGIIDPTAHLYNFNLSTLKKIVETAGLRILVAEHYPITDALKSLVYRKFTFIFNKFINTWSVLIVAVKD